MVELLPAPFGPSRAKVSPGSMVKSTPATATNEPKVLTSSFATTGSMSRSCYWASGERGRNTSDKPAAVMNNPPKLSSHVDVPVIGSVGVGVGVGVGDGWSGGGGGSVGVGQLPSASRSMTLPSTSVPQFTGPKGAGGLLGSTGVVGQVPSALGTMSMPSLSTPQGGEQVPSSFEAISTLAAFKHGSAGSTGSAGSVGSGSMGVESGVQQRVTPLAQTLFGLPSSGRSGRCTE
jgi:hypothetical protein